MIALWIRRLWPLATVAALLAVSTAALLVLVRSCTDPAALQVAHEATTVATQASEQADAIVRVDTVERRVFVVRAQTLRDSALRHLTDTVIVKHAFRADSVALARSDSSLDKAARASVAKDVLVSALRTELRISERLRAPRFRVSSYAGADVDGVVPITGAEIDVRVTGHWSAVGRVEKRWSAGEPTRRLLFVRYTL